MYFDSPMYLGLGIFFLFSGGMYEYSTSNEDQRIALLLRNKRFSCKEEIERYLYYKDM